MLILLTTIMLSGMGFGLVLPGFLFFAENLGASPAVATTIVATYSMGQFISTPIWGRLSDRFGRKPILVISLFGSAVSYLLVAFAPNLWVLALGRALTGLMAGNLSAAMAYVSDVTPVEKRAHGMGLVGASMSLGFIVGPALGGVLGGADAATATLRLPGLVAAGICFVTVVGAALFLKESLPPEARARHAEGPQVGQFEAIRRVLSRPVLAQFVVVGLLVYLAMSVFETIFPLWANARFEWGPREVGFSFMYLGILVSAVQGVLVGRLVPLFGEEKLAMTGLLAYAIGLVIMTQAPDWQVAMVGITFTAGGGAMYITTMSSLISKQAAENERGFVLGVYQSASWFGRSFGPPIAGVIFHAVSPDSPLVTGAVLMVLSLVILGRVLRRAARA